MNTKSTGIPRPRLTRLLLGRNELRRSCDRIEGAVLVALSLAFLTAIVAAALLAGAFYQSQGRTAASLRPAAAVVPRPGPVVGNADVLYRGAIWRLADGAERSGLLASAVAPERLNTSGSPAPPPGRSDNAAGVVLGTTFLLAGVAALLNCCYVLCRIALDRHRLARWDEAWAVTGPRWTSCR